MLARFTREHWHDEDEVRFIIEGRGLFHVHPADGPVFAIEVEAGDLIRVPRGTHHWFDLCADRRIRAIRLFQDPVGLDAPLHGYGHRPGIPARVLRTVVPDATLHPRARERQARGRRRAGHPAGRRGHDDAARLCRRDALPVRAHTPQTPRRAACDRARLRAAAGSNCATSTTRIVRLASPCPVGRYARGRAPASVVAYLEWLMDRDRKSTGSERTARQDLGGGLSPGRPTGRGLCRCAGRPRALAGAGLEIGIFSSGSVLAQQLLFRHSPAGDLTGLSALALRYDVGPKADAESYHRIAAAMTLPARPCCSSPMLCGNSMPARAAGLQTRLASVQVMRRHRWPWHAVHTFDEVA